MPTAGSGTAATCGMMKNEFGPVVGAGDTRKEHNLIARIDAGQREAAQSCSPGIQSRY